MRNAPAATELRTIRVYGTLAKVIGCRTLRAAVSSVPEAMRFLMANFPQVEGHLKGRFFKVKVSSWDLTEDELKAPIGRTEDVHIIPAICGAGGNNPLTGILAGTALIGIGLLIPFTGPLLIPLGLGLLLNGVAGMLSPTPEVEDKENDPSRSYNFSGIQQTASEGIPVPLVYGDIFTGSVVLSVGIEEDDDDDGDGVGGGGGGGGAAGGTFNSGTGNPSPNPNPVPDPEDPPLAPGTNAKSRVASERPGGWAIYQISPWPDCGPTGNSVSIPDTVLHGWTGCGPTPHSLVKVQDAIYNVSITPSDPDFGVCEIKLVTITQGEVWKVVDANGATLGIARPGSGGSGYRQTFDAASHNATGGMHPASSDPSWYAPEITDTILCNDSVPTCEGAGDYCTDEEQAALGWT